MTQPSNMKLIHLILQL